MEIHPTAHPKASMCLPATGLVSPPNALYVQQHKGGPKKFVSKSEQQKHYINTALGIVLASNFFIIEIEFTPVLW